MMEIENWMRGLWRRGDDDRIERDIRERWGERTKESERHRSAEGYLFCLAALLNTELPLPKETEHKAQFRDMCVASIPKGPFSALYQ